jgi:predicted TIM-barrel fold metal-dependent hydrolase
MEQTVERVLIVSSDGHAMPQRVRDYREYLPSAFHERFDAYCAFAEAEGFKPPSDPGHLCNRLDAEWVEQWRRDLYEPGRLVGLWDPRRRLAELERDGISGEVLFHDFGLPFEGPPPSRAYQGSTWPVPTYAESTEGRRAHNRWLADFVSVAPERFCPMASVLFDDVDAAVADIRWAHAAGMRGVTLPTFTSEHPLYHPRYELIWSLLEELDMPANSHVAISSTVTPLAFPSPHPGTTIPLHGGEMRFRCNEILSHLVWGGVLERHPKLRVAFTEQGSAWIVGALESMDFTYDGSYLRRDVHQYLPMRPSEYFRRQCWLGSSIFSQAEVEARHAIGLEAMLLGMDFPHHEGTFAAGGTVEYLRATVGAAGVPADEARRLLGGNHIDRWGFDAGALREVADRVGPELDLLLTPPDEDLFPRGDVHKPMGSTSLGAGG